MSLDEIRIRFVVSKNGFRFIRNEKIVLPVKIFSIILGWNSFHAILPIPAFILKVAIKTSTIAFYFEVQILNKNTA